MPLAGTAWYDDFGAEVVSRGRLHHRAEFLCATAQPWPFGPIVRRTVTDAPVTFAVASDIGL